MEHLCIGSFVRVLTSCAVTAEHQFTRFCEKIMMSLVPEGETSFYYTSSRTHQEVTYSTSNFEKIQLSRQNIPSEIKDMAEKKGAYAIQQYFSRKIIPNLEENLKASAILALKKIIQNDKTIAENAQLGTIKDSKKSELRDQKEFILSEFLTDIFIFALTQTNNMLDPQFTKSIGKNYCDNFINLSNDIRLYETTLPKPLPLIPKTIKKDFNSVFSRISTEVLSFSDVCDLKIYALKFEDFEFDYQTLHKYLRSNIGYYLYSRKKIAEYVDMEDEASISYDAVDDMRRTISKMGIQPGDKLGEILLYVFLEGVLNAPKLMSNAEIENFGGHTTSNSNGIHLLTLDGLHTSSQLVLGTAIINGNLYDAINRAFAKAADLKRNKSSEHRFVETHILPNSFSKEMREELASIIIPSESRVSKPISSFGFFLGYTLNHVPNAKKSVAEYQAAVIAQIKSDIKENLGRIKDAVEQNGLTGYPLYIYLLPFNDADIDKQRIMNRLLQIGEDTG